MYIMLSRKQLYFAFLSTILSQVAAFNVDSLKIPPKHEKYEFWLTLDTQMTMMEVDENGDGNVFLWDSKAGKLMKRLANIDESSTCDALKPETNGSRIVTGDGRHREYISINGQLPGPTLVVYEGSEVVVHVKNNLAAREVSVHFHGMLQNGTFWSDGAAMVSQCPIRPGETFTYQFKAEPCGSTFYHGHFVADRGDGLHGAFIVLPSDYEESSDVQEFPVFLSDWFKGSAEHEYAYAKWGLGSYYPGFENLKECYKESRTFDYGVVGEFNWHSALINGRGWHKSKEMETAPLAEFKVKKTSDTIFRLIHGGINFPFLFSVTEHFLNVTHADGTPIVPVMTDVVMIYPGERFDVHLVPKPGKKCSICGIFASSVEYYTGAGAKLNDARFVMGKLVYELDGDEKPITTLEHTTTNPILPMDFSDTNIRVFNCPFGPEFSGFPSTNYSCIDTNSMASLHKPQSPALATEFADNELKEIFLSVYRDTDLNGVTFVYPVAPPALFSEADIGNVTVSCPVDSDGLTPEGSSCTQVVNLDLEKPVQIVLYNRGSKLEDSKDLDAFAHPIHMHGVHFHVVKIGYPEYNGSDGTISKFNDDIACPEGSEQCNSGTWSNEKWLGGKVPGLNLETPVAKDTIPVPVGGYVVLRLMPPSAGWWLMHCHFMPHHLDGMALLFKVGTESDLPPRPPGFPMCYNYDVPNVAMGAESGTLHLKKAEFAGAIVGMGIVAFLIGGIIGFLFKRKRSAVASANPTVNYSVVLD